MNYEPGVLYLIPSTLTGVGAQENLPQNTLRVISSLKIFIVETPKVARNFLKQANPKQKIQEVEMHVLNEHTSRSDLAALITPLKRGNNVGLISDAGCPAIADPGAELVNLAHQTNIKVVPLIGPSSIFLALMASGFNGQEFVFHGYLPAKLIERDKAIAHLEMESRSKNRTQIFIETPYRNQQMLKSILGVCKSTTQLCIASDINSVSENIHTRKISEWRSVTVDIDKKPTVFLLHS